MSSLMSAPISLLNALDGLAGGAAGYRRVMDSLDYGWP